jgi:Flp pilus assembly secretin CpaC
LYTEVTAPQGFANFPTQASFHDGGVTNIIMSNFGTGGAPRYERIAASVVGTTLNASPVIAAGGLLKQAIAYAASDFALSANAGTVGTVTTGNVPTVNALRLGGYATGSNNLLNGYLRRVVYYPRRLSNAELQSITS